LYFCILVQKFIFVIDFNNNLLSILGFQKLFTILDHNAFFFSTCYNKILKMLLEIEKNGPNRASKIKEVFRIFQAYKQKHLVNYISINFFKKMF
jgi:hypothetical protein